MYKFCSHIWSILIESIWKYEHNIEDLDKIRLKDAEYYIETNQNYGLYHLHNIIFIIHTTLFLLSSLMIQSKIYYLAAQSFCNCTYFLHKL